MAAIRSTPGRLFKADAGKMSSIHNVLSTIFFRRVISLVLLSAPRSISGARKLLLDQQLLLPRKGYKAMSPRPLREAPRDLSGIATLEESLILPHFTADDAYDLGVSIRQRLRSLSQLAAVVSISHANTSNLLFHATSRPGIQPDNDIWVSRKRRTVLRWGVSTWFMGNKFSGDEAEFARKYALGAEAGTYAIHGGGVPIRVEGVEGIVGVVVVSGLKQNEDHMVVIEGLQEFVERCKEDGLSRADTAGSR